MRDRFDFIMGSTRGAGCSDAVRADRAPWMRFGVVDDAELVGRLHQLVEALNEAAGAIFQIGVSTPQPSHGAASLAAERHGLYLALIAGPPDGTQPPPDALTPGPAPRFWTVTDDATRNIVAVLTETTDPFADEQFFLYVATTGVLVA